MDLPTICRKCENKADKETSLYHSPHFDIYFEFCDIKPNNFTIPTCSLIAYCNQCIFKTIANNFSNCFHQCPTCNLFSTTYTCSVCPRKNMDHWENINQEEYPTRTCLKCGLTQEPLSKEKLNDDFTPTDDNDSTAGASKLRTKITLAPNAFMCGGFSCDGKWIYCEDGIGENTIGLHSNIYNLKEDINGYVCNECFSKMETELVLPVTCDVCLKKYESVMPDSKDQGYGCASSMTDGKIICGYGSLHDCSIYRWCDMIRPDKYRNYNLICDNCIDELIADKMIIYHRDYM